MAKPSSRNRAFIATLVLSTAAMVSPANLAARAGQANHIFLEASTFPSGGLGADSVVVADVNGDGKPDVVVANSESVVNSFDGSVAILLGNGDGTFQLTDAYDTGGPAMAVAVADVNGDGIPDLLVANFDECSGCPSEGTVGVLLGKGDGTFRQVVTYKSGAWGSTSVAVADVNGDGKPDLIVADNCPHYNNCTAGGVVTVLLGNGDGTFQTPVAFGTGSLNATFVAVADVNGDGKPDLLVATDCYYLRRGCSAGSGSVAVLLGNGNGTFQPAEIYGSGGNGAVFVTVADLNGDGKLDLVVANDCLTPNSCQKGGVGVLLGNGDGTFQPAMSFDYGSGEIGVFSVAMADVNGDGKPDLITANPNICGNCADGAVSVLLGKGDGTFYLAETYAPGGFAGESVAVADVNGDGKPDVLVAASSDVHGNGMVGLLLGNGNGTFQAARIYTDRQRFVYSMAAGDLNGDGKPDLVETEAGLGIFPQDQVLVYFGRGDGSLETPLIYDLGGAAANAVAIADVNGDGKPDLLVASGCNDASNLCTGVVNVLLNKGDGTFRKPESFYAGGYATRSVAVGDVNGDGKPDLIVANDCLSYNHCDKGIIGVLLGNGDGTFQAPVRYGSGGYDAASVAVADLNGDGKLDIVVANSCIDSGCYSNSNVGVLLGNGDGTFQKAVTYPAGGASYGYDGFVTVADINGDGKPDLITANDCSFAQCEYGGGLSTVAVLLGNGDGTFQKPIVTRPGGDGSDLVIADFNGDGKLDVASGAGDVLLLGNGDGTFQTPLLLGMQGEGIASADFNLDGKPDIVAGPAAMLLNISSVGTPHR